MNVDTIISVVREIEKIPYKVILFDGLWGIGKSYAVDETLKEKKNVCSISMFGMKKPSGIYHEVLFQAFFKNDKGGKLAKTVAKTLGVLGDMKQDANQNKKLVSEIIKEKDIFSLVSSNFKSPYIVVIDDLERIGSELDLREVLGIIEDLKRCNYVKVILVANTEELDENKRKILNCYHEKVIDKTYHITERASKINWDNLNINARFINEFLENHKVINLRTLEKAQKFLEDVERYCEHIDNETFHEEIRLICFAVVVESIDKLYYREIKDEESVNDMVRTAIELGNILVHRIENNYLAGIKCNGSLCNRLTQYYKNNITLSRSDIDLEYELFCQAGQKANYYKSDWEIKIMLSSLQDKMNEAKDMDSLNKFADTYIGWSDIIGEDNKEVLEKYRKRLRSILEDIVKNDGELESRYDNDLSVLQSKKTRKIYLEQIRYIEEFKIDYFIKMIVESKNDKEILEYSKKLLDCYKSGDYKEILSNRISCLYDRRFFPVDDMNDTKNRFCRNIGHILYYTDDKEFLKYCKQLEKDCDKMALHRLKNFTKYFDGEE